MKSRSVCFVLATLLTMITSARAQTPEIPDIPFEKFELDNGLTLIVHEDHKAPIVAVNVWYHVGSKNEPPGRSGFAHLFEHLMFNGSENFDDDYFQVLERIGATELNGTTNRDRTNYFQNVPVSALDLALWMESDRMGHLLGAVDQERLDEQRGVVQNEKRQSEDQPYGQVWNRITDATWPEGHPYAHTVIGSMEDLNAATVDDVHNWFTSHYGPNNAVIVLAGDIDAASALEKVEHYFGDIPPGPPLARFDSWVVKLSGEQREVMQDRVPQARIYKVWNIPEIDTREYSVLSLLDELLTDGKTSRLYKRLVYDDQIATDVSMYVDAREIGSQIVLWATVQPEGDLVEVERALEEEMTRFLTEGPTEDELQRAKTRIKSSFIRGIQRIGGFGGKSDILAMSDVYYGQPDGYKRQYADMLDATADDLQSISAKWMSDGVYSIEVHPFPELMAAEAGADRSQQPAVADPPVAEFPDLQRVTLSNGMNVMVAERHAVPLVEFQLLVDAGYAADADAKPGTANLAMDMIDEGTESRNSLEISDELAGLGATLWSGSNLDMSSVGMSTLRENLSPSLDLFADVALNPSFPGSELDRLRQDQLASIRQEKMTPIQMALRVFPKLIYGEGHAYSLPLTGSGTEASVSSITRDDLADFHETWFKPNNSTLVVTGDVRMDELRPLLEERFGAWPQGKVPEKNVREVPQPQGDIVYLVDRPGSIQSMIIAGHLAPPRSNPDEVAIETMNTVFGGAFTSRVNMNLREEKGWSYGAFASMYGARGQRPYFVYAPVQTDKTKESIEELRMELRGILGEKPIKAEELEMAKGIQTLTLAGQWETLGAVRNSIAEMVRYDLPEDYFEKYPSEVNALDVEDLEEIAGRVLLPEHFVWVVVGDREQIEPGLRELGFDEIRHLDADGNPAG